MPSPTTGPSGTTSPRRPGPRHRAAPTPVGLRTPRGPVGVQLHTAASNCTAPSRGLRPTDAQLRPPAVAGPESRFMCNCTPPRSIARSHEPRLAGVHGRTGPPVDSAGVRGRGGILATIRPAGRARPPADRSGRVRALTHFVLLRVRPARTCNWTPRCPIAAPTPAGARLNASAGPFAGPGGGVGPAGARQPGCSIAHRGVQLTGWRHRRGRPRGGHTCAGSVGRPPTGERLRRQCPGPGVRGRAAGPACAIARHGVQLHTPSGRAGRRVRGSAGTMACGKWCRACATHAGGHGSLGPWRKARTRANGSAGHRSACCAWGWETGSGATWTWGTGWACGCARRTGRRASGPGGRDGTSWRASCTPGGRRDA